MDAYVPVALWRQFFIIAMENKQEVSVPWKGVPVNVTEFNGKVYTNDDFKDLVLATTTPDTFGQIQGEEGFHAIMGDLANRLANQLLLVAEAEKDGYVPSNELSEKIFQQHVASTPPEQMEQFVAFLEQQESTLEEFKERVLRNTSLQRQAVIDTWGDEVLGKDITVSDAEIEDYYQKLGEVVRVQQILMVPKNNTQVGRVAAFSRAERALERINAGEEFDKISKELSDCNNVNLEVSGDLGEIRRGQMVQTFEDVAFSLAEGEISDIIKTPLGCHIIRVLSRRQEELHPLEKIKEPLRARLKYMKINDEVLLRLAKAKEQANITVKLR